MSIYFPEPSSVLASMFFHVEPENDFAIRCILQKYHAKWIQIYNNNMDDSDRW
jgi:hypothetical protein